MSKPWEHYFNISPAIVGEERRALLRSLDQIWEFTDGEGRTLFEQAFRRNGNQPIAIDHSTSGRGTEIEEIGTGSAMRQVLHISFQDERTRGYNSRFGPIKSSLTSTLIHELYHIADDRTDIETQTVLSVCRMTGYSPESNEMTSLNSSADRLVSLGRARTRFEALAQIVIRPAILMDRSVVDDYSSPLMRAITAVPTEARVARLRTDGVVSGRQSLSDIYTYGTIGRDEQDSTSYTDALRAKYFPSTEPPQGVYTNVIFVDPHMRGAGTLLFNRTETPSATMGFTAVPYSIASLGHIEPPPHVDAYAPSRQRK
ncbi:MAG: hypothetical protein ACOYJ2_00220 [Rickettsiales bacterium]